MKKFWRILMCVFLGVLSISWINNGNVIGYFILILQLWLIYIILKGKLDDLKIGHNDGYGLIPTRSNQKFATHQNRIRYHNEQFKKSKR